MLSQGQRQDGNHHTNVDPNRPKGPEKRPPRRSIRRVLRRFGEPRHSRIVWVGALAVSTLCCTGVTPPLESVKAVDTLRSDLGAGDLEGSADPATNAPEARERLVQFARHYSPAVYNQIATRSISAEVIVEQAARAIVPATLCAREEDLLFDDTYCGHTGNVIYLGVENNAAVAFMSRYLVDMTYPTDFESDGWFASEWREHTLKLHDESARIGDDIYLLRKIDDDAAVPSFPNSGTAYYRTFGWNDVVLAYFPIAPDTFFGIGLLQSLDIPMPTETFRQTIAQATNLFGEEFYLISPPAFHRMRNRAKAEGIINASTIKTAALMVAACYALPALGLDAISMGSALDEAVSHLVEGGVASELWADTLPIPVQLAGNWLLEGGRVDILGEGGKQMASMLLATLPGPKTEQGRRILEFLSQFATASPTAVRFDDQVVIFDPQSKVNLNHELLAHGLARLDTSDPDLAAMFPELAQAASDALDEGRAYADEWRNDWQYVKDVHQLCNAPLASALAVRR